MAPKPSLRTQNRLRAMRAAQSIALDRFEARGFDQVSVEEIAEAAGVSPRTLYRHFGTKERLVLWDELDGPIEAGLESHLGRSTPFADLRAGLLEAFRAVPADPLQLLRRRSHLIDQHSSLLGAAALEWEETRREVTQALQKVYRKPKDPAKLDMVVRIAFAALQSGIETWQRSKRAKLIDCLEKAFAAVDRAYELDG